MTRYGYLTGDFKCEKGIDYIQDQIRVNSEGIEENISIIKTNRVDIEGLNINIFKTRMEFVGWLEKHTLLDNK